MPNRELYILDDKGEPVICRDPKRARAWAAEVDRSVAFEQLGIHRVVTVFTGVPSGTDSAGKPLLWETAIATPKDVTIVRRYASLKEAAAGHDEVAANVRLAMSPPASAS